MRSRLLGGLLLTILAVAVLWLCWPQPRIGPTSFQRIKEGMSPEQVQEIIGLPPGDYYTGPDIGGLSGPFGHKREERGRPLDEFRRASAADQQNGYVESWWGNNYAIYVAFDETNRAVGWELLDVVPGREPLFFELMRQRVGW